MRHPLVFLAGVFTGSVALLATAYVVTFRGLGRIRL